MNKIYRTVYNAATDTWVVASELATGRRKTSKTAMALAVAAALALPGGIARAGTNKEEDAVEQEIAMVNAAPNAVDTAATGSGAFGTASIGTESIGTMAALDDTYIKVNTGSGAAAQATGGNAIAMGVQSQGTGGNSVAIGPVAVSGGNFSVALGSRSTVDAAAEYGVAIGRQATVTAAGTGSVALGQASVADRENTVSVGSAAQQRQIINVADGTQATDAVNVRQMTDTLNTALATKADDTYFKVRSTGAEAQANAGEAIAIGAGAIANGAVSIAAGFGAQANGDRSIAIGSAANVDTAAQFGMALGRTAQVTAAGTNSVALGQGSIADRGNTVSVGSATQQRQVTNVAAGTQDTDAVNYGQMTTALSTKTDDTYIKVGQGQTPANAAVTSGRAGNIAIGSNAKSTGAASGSATIALGENSEVSGLSGSVAVGTNAHATGTSSIAIGVNANASAANSVALGVNSVADQANTVSLGSATTQRRIVNMAAGTAGTDAVNVSQLTPVVNALGGDASIDPTTGAVTGPTYNLANGGTQTTVGAALGALDGQLTTAKDNIAKNTTAIGDIRNEMNSGTIGLVQQAGAGQKLTVGANTDGAEVDFTGSAGTRKLTGITNGTVSAASTDAINGSQLHGVSTSVASAIGAGSAVNPDGSITAPSFTVGDGKGGTTVVHNVGDVVGNLDGRVTNNETAIGDIRNEMNSGTIGLVQQAAAGQKLTVGANTDGAEVDFTGTDGTRKLTGITNGTVSDTSKDAINGSQLHGVSTSVADAIGAGSTVNPDGSITAPSFTVGDGAGGTKTVHNVGDVVGNLDGRMTTAEGNITNIRNEMNSGTIGLVQQNPTTGAITVAAGLGGSVVNFAGMGGTTRVLTGLSNGVVAAGSTDAVTGDQLHTVKTELENKMDAGLGDLEDRADKLEGRTTDLEGRTDNLEARTGNLEGSVGDLEGKLGSIKDTIAAGSDGKGENSTVVGKGADASGKNSSAIGNGSVASGENSSAIGQGAVAKGDNSTAIGQGSSATGNNSVALGQGSVADRDNTVSVGREGAERQLTNLAAGTAPTDAVNVQQMSNAVHSARQDAMGGVAAAMAIAGLPQSSMPGKTFMAISGSTYGNEYGTAIGASYMTKDGKWVVKGAVNTSSRGEVGAVVGGGFYW